MKLSTYVVTEMAHGGYGYIGQQYRRLLLNHGMTLLAQDQFGWDRLLAFTPPRATIVGPHARPDIVLHTMFEATPMPEPWVTICNRVGLVWSPSTWCADLMREAGVTTPIMVAGYGFDERALIPVDRRGRTGPLRVRLWGDVLVSRKNVLTSMNAFVQADIPGATLEIKLNDSFFRDSTVVDGDGLQPHPHIKLHTQPMSREELIQWLADGDVLLYLSGGEGYGLQPLEAMATAMPVIAMRETGMRMYMQAGALLEVPSLGLTPAPSLTAIYGYPLAIHKPDVAAAIQHLHWVAENRDAAAELGQHGYETIRALTWDRAARDAADQLRIYTGIA